MFDRSRIVSPTMAILGGAAYIVAIVQYAVAQVIAATAWNPPYNWRTNVISDLGNTACGQFSVHGPTSYVCSPRHTVMNTSFVITGALIIAGTLLLWRFWPARKITTVALALLLAAGVGKIIVGLVPENTMAGLHSLGAFNIVLGSIAIAMLSLAILSRERDLAIFGLAVAVVGLVGSVWFIGAQSSESAHSVALGIGAIERLADYPSAIWTFVVGCVAILHARQQALPVTRWPVPADAARTAQG